jgi:hypothetical protein
MWRTRAVLDMLFEDIGGLAHADEAALAKARRRAVLAVAFDWLAIVLLVVLHSGEAPQLTLEGGEQTLFTLGILAVAVHSGFRLGQLQKLRRIGRLAAELEARASE